MVDLQKFKAKVCLTASGTLIHNHKILLVKHKKLGFWLTPGGHIDPGEMPHQAAVREFWEETGIRVRVVDRGFHLKSDHPLGDMLESDKVEYLPLPLSCNLHWISKQNYDHRLNGKDLDEKTKKNWKKGCEMHMDMRFLVEPIDGVDFKQNIEETDGIAWFGLEEIEDLETSESIKAEIKQAFELIND